MRDGRETRTRSGDGPLQHLQVAVRVAECHERTAADEPADRDGLAVLVIDKIDSGKLDENGLAVAHLELLLAAAADHPLGTLPLCVAMTISSSAFSPPASAPLRS